MSEYISPIDRHRHFGDAGRAECAVCCLEAERDQLLAVCDAVGAESIVAIVDERNELRVVVNALLGIYRDAGGTREGLRWVLSDRGYTVDVIDAADAVHAQLDASPNARTREQ